MSWTSSSTGEELVRAFQDRVRGRTFLITGPSANGIGEATAIALASSPAPPSIIILAGRSQSKISSVIEAIKEINPTISVIFVHLDLSSRTSIETAATTIIEDVKVNKIDVLINNAGIMACPYTPLDWSGIGETILESQFVVNYVGVFLFTNLILPKVRKAAPGARIINVSSSGHRFSGIRWDDIGFKGGHNYDTWDAYGQSKTAVILMTIALASRYANGEIASFSVHPGAVHTELGRFMNPSDRSGVVVRVKATPDFELPIPKTVQQGCATTLRAALDPELEGHSGSYLHDCQPADPAAHAKDLQQAERLWKLTENILAKTF